MYWFSLFVCAILLFIDVVQPIHIICQFSKFLEMSIFFFYYFNASYIAQFKAKIVIDYVLYSSLYGINISLE
uniref:Putative ovule protein n=1 Tax=Solanum chacoense TaxID=4108 RepID=A0A0V0H766_SOLCH